MLAMSSPVEASPSGAAARVARRTWVVPAALLLATLLSATFSGAVQSVDGAAVERWGSAASAAWHQLASGLPYALALLSILVAHEAGHAIAARIHGVPASLPHFIPLPYPLSPVGTLGAVIGLRAEVRSRNALVDIAAAGPLAGLAVALPVLAWGIHLSPVGPSHAGDLLEGQSILYLLLKLAVKGELLPGHGRDLQLHPVAFAGWVGLLVTAINLIPVGPLDGGHLAAAALGAGHDRRSRIVHRLLPVVGLVVMAIISALALRSGAGRRSLALGAQAGMPWIIWSGVLLLLRRLQGGRWHEPVGEEPLTRGRKAVLAVTAVAFVLIFMPWVMREAL